MRLTRALINVQHIPGISYVYPVSNHDWGIEATPERGLAVYAHLLREQ